MNDCSVNERLRQLSEQVERIEKMSKSEEITPEVRQRQENIEK